MQQAVTALFPQPSQEQRKFVGPGNTGNQMPSGAMPSPTPTSPPTPTDPGPGGGGPPPVSPSTSPTGSPSPSGQGSPRRSKPPGLG